MVKLVVLDVDGVIVGHKSGVNFPYPSKTVIEALKKVRQSGIPIILCTGKYQSAIIPIIQKAELDNPHITDAGSLIINPLEDRVIHAYTLDKQVASEIIAICLQNKVHIEAYSTENFFIQKDPVGEILHRRLKILQKEPVIVDSLPKTAKHQAFIKLLPAVTNEQEKQKLTNLLKPYVKQVSLVWTMHPATIPWEYCLITAPNASKAKALTEVVKKLDISLNATLGVGDTLGDWEFMNLCGYVATMEDASPELKKLVEAHEAGKFLIAPSVDEDGILQILDYFLK